MNYRKFFAIISLFIYQTVFAQLGEVSNLVKMELIKGQDKVHQNSLLKVALKVNIEKDWHINSNKPNEDFLIGTKVISEDERFPIAKISYPEPKEFLFKFSDKPVSVFDGEIIIGLLINIDKSMPLGSYKIPVRFRYQACNDQLCLPPASLTDTLEISVVDNRTTVNKINQNLFANLDDLDKSGFWDNTIDQISTQSTTKKLNNSVASTLESSGFFFSLILIFLGGLALNLTPCVYPLIPITVGYFGGQSEGSTSRLFLFGILYVLGMSLTYSIIGVVTSLSGAIFGTLMQNKFVVIAIALLFVVLALSQFGVYEFKLPNTLVAKAGGAKGGALGAFFMGLTMGIVAAPCIGPFVIGLVTFVAAKGDPLYGFLMFFVLAVGLGLPYLLLALFSGKIKKLPRAGDWMVGVEHIFGFLLLGMALYFVGPILPKAINKYLLPIFGILSALFLLFIDRIANNIKTFRIFKIIFSIVVIAISIYAIIPSKKIEPDWQKFSEAKYEQSLKNKEGMIVDFYADWCIPCKELDALTFSDPRVLEKSKKFTNYKVDMTQTLSDETEKLRNRFSIIGIPTVLIINSKGEEVERITGFVNADEFLKLLEKAD